MDLDTDYLSWDKTAKLAMDMIATRDIQPGEVSKCWL
jgi:hypothetical protein